MENTEEIKSLIQKSLEDNITLEEFYSDWNEKWNENEFLSKVFNDIESTIEHKPGFFFKPGLNRKKWINSPLYLTLKVDYELLDSVDMKSPNVLLFKRTQMLKDRC